MSADIADPRDMPAPGAARSASIELAAASVAASTATRASEIDATLSRSLADRLSSGQALSLSEEIAAAPSVAIARALWRGLIGAWALSSRPPAGETVSAVLFALPVVVVAASAERADASPSALAGVLPDTGRLSAILREHHALAGSQSFALANALVAADAIDIAHWSALLSWQRLVAGAPPATHDLPPTPIAVPCGGQGVHLRFLMGTALMASDADLAAASVATGWAMPLAQELARQLAVPGFTVLALPRPPASPPAALQHGRAAQREVGAQLFASNAIRNLRASVGEPAAVISAHRAATAPGGGELRLSLSSPFDLRRAEGFRCPLFPTDRAVDVAAMLVELLHDCRVADVRIMPGVHPDREEQTGLTLLFKAGALPRAEQASLH